MAPADTWDFVEKALAEKNNFVEGALAENGDVLKRLWPKTVIFVKVENGDCVEVAHRTIWK